MNGLLAAATVFSQDSVRSHYVKYGIGYIITPCFEKTSHCILLKVISRPRYLKFLLCRILKNSGMWLWICPPPHVCAKCHHCTLWKIVPRLSQHEKPCMFWEVSKQDTCLDATSLVSGNISIYAYAHLRFTLLSTLEPVYKDGIPVPHSLSSITCCYRPTSHTLGVENCHLPSTMPVAVNIGLALYRAAMQW